MPFIVTHWEGRRSDAGAGSRPRCGVGRRCRWSHTDGLLGRVCEPRIPGPSVARCDRTCERAGCVQRARYGSWFPRRLRGSAHPGREDRAGGRWGPTLLQDGTAHRTEPVIWESHSSVEAELGLQERFLNFSSVYQARKSKQHVLLKEAQ